MKDSQINKKPGRQDEGRFQRLAGKGLNMVERCGNRLPDPLILFILMMLFVPLASAVAAFLDWERAHPVTGEVVSAVNLLTGEGIAKMLTTAVDNFTSFPPLGVVLVAMLGIGLAEKSGFIEASLKGFVRVVPNQLLTGALVFAGVISNLAVDAGYVILVPLGGVLFAGVGRHPLAGMAAGFAGVSGGFSANLIVTSVDPLLAGFTNAAAELYQPGYQVEATGNYYFMFVSTFLIVAGGWWVTDKIVEPRLGPWKSPQHLNNQQIGIEPLNSSQSKALKLSWLGIGVGLIAIALMVIPDNAILRNETGDLAPFYEALIPLLAVVFIIPGLIYGLVSGSVKKGSDLSKMLGDTMGSMGGYLVLAFVAAQFVAYFQWSNLGLLIALAGAEFLKSTGASSIVLLLGVVALSGSVNLFIGSASAKWGLMAPVLVPMMMSLGFSPEMAQAAFRIGDSSTNVITPLLPYFPIILAFAQKYQSDLKLGTLVSIMLPYSIVFALLWSLQMVIWFWLGIPLGPDAPMLMP